MAPKRRRRSRSGRRGQAALQKLLHRGRVTQEGLADIIKTFRQVEADLPATLSRQGINRANHARFESIRHEIAMPLARGGEFKWHLAEPNRLLTLMVSESPTLQDLFEAALARHGAPSQGRPWTLVIGYDEFSPGGMFAVDDDKKSMNLSYTFLELGEHNIRSDCAWFTPVIVRSSWFPKVVGSWGAMLTKYLKLHLLGPNGLATAGAPIVVNGRHVLIFATLEYTIADLEGHRMSMNSTGAGGYRPCLRHCNVLRKNCGLEDLGDYVEISCADPTLFRLHSSADVFFAADLVSASHARWQAGVMTKGRFENIEKSCGLRFAPYGVLLDTDLRLHVDVVDSTVIDWVHTALQDGTFTTEVFQLVHACGEEPLEISFADVREFLQDDDWCFPAWARTKSSMLYRVFDQKRAPNEDKIRANASELLGLYALLRHFVEKYLLDVAIEQFQRQAASFQAACKTLDVISMVKQGRVGMREGAVELRRVHAEHLRLHIEAYGTDHILPKHHMMFDVADQWERRDAVIDAFVVERLHIRVKNVMAPIRNTRDFEVSCLASSINSHLQALEVHAFGDALVGRTSKFPGTQVPIADKMVVSGLTICVGDVVLFQGAAGKVCACATENGRYLALVETFVHVAQVTMHSDKWAVGGRLEAWPAEAVQTAPAWYMLGAEVIALGAL